MAQAPLPIARLRPNPRNPRRITPARLRLLERAMRRFGDLSGITFNVRTGQLLAGHQRTHIARQHLQSVVITQAFDPPTEVGTVRLGYLELGGERFAYREVDWDPATADAAGIAANQAAGAFEVPLLHDALSELDAMNFEMGLTMFDEGQLDALLGGAPAPEEARAVAAEPSYRVVVECRDVHHQVQVLATLEGQGFEVRASGG